MSRNASGVYSLPSSVNPVVTNTQITTNWANTTLNDLASEMTNSLDRNGRGRMNVPFLMLDGSLANPSFAFTNAPNSGIYNYGSGKLGFSVGGVLQMILGPTGVEGTLNVPTQAAADNSTKVASTAFVQSVAFNTVNLPAQAGNANKYVKTDGTNATWQFVNLQTGVESVLNSSMLFWGDTGGPFQAAGFRNVIINPAMDVSRRVVPGTIPAGGNGRPIDKWYVNFGATTAAATPSRTFDSPVLLDDKARYSLRLTVTTADAAVGAADFGYVQQSIEGYMARRLYGKTFTLSFWVRSSKTGLHTIWLSNLVDRQYVSTYTVNLANTWEQKTITVTGGITTAGGTWNFENGWGLHVGWPLIAGANFVTASPNTWLASASPLATVAGTVNDLDTIGNIFAITGVQLEVGATATPLEIRPFSQELDLCQRYYRAGPSAATGVAVSTTVASLTTGFPTEMRAAPALVSISATGVTFTSAGSTAAINGAWTAGNITTTAGVFVFTRGAGTWTAGDAVILNHTDSPVAWDADF